MLGKKARACTISEMDALSTRENGQCNRTVLEENKVCISQTKNTARILSMK